ncbi:DUF916 domain-containing protein [Paenibacillus glucanolyticus]|nr:DUF916 domain-containing protein [Paenibacillus glucanolyticus]
MKTIYQQFGLVNRRASGHLRRKLFSLAMMLIVTLSLAPENVNAAEMHRFEYASSENLTQQEIDPALAPEASFLLSPSKEARNGLGYYRDEVIPGEKRKYTFYVKNLLDEKINLKIYATDALPAQNGGRGFGSYNTGVTLGGSWFYPQGPKDITLGPNEMREYTYTVKIPENLEPGQHIGVVGVSQFREGQEIKTNIENATLTPDVLEELGMWVVMDYKIDKAKHGMSINSLNHDYVASGESRFTIDLENKGTILEQPTGYLEIRDSAKKVVFREDYEAGSIYYGTTAKMVSIAENQLLLPGNYEAYFEANFNGQKEWRIFQFTVTPKEKDEAQAAMEHSQKLEVTDGIPDWLKYVIVIGLLLILLLLILLLLSKRKKGDIEDRIKMYLEKGFTFDKARKKVQLDQKTFTLYVVKLGYVPDGSEPEWHKTIHTSKYGKRIERVENSTANLEDTFRNTSGAVIILGEEQDVVTEGSASSENLKRGEDDVGKGA